MVWKKIWGEEENKLARRYLENQNRERATYWLTQAVHHASKRAMTTLSFLKLEMANNHPNSPDSATLTAESRALFERAAVDGNAQHNLELWEDISNLMSVLRETVQNIPQTMRNYIASPVGMQRTIHLTAALSHVISRLLIAKQFFKLFCLEIDHVVTWNEFKHICESVCEQFMAVGRAQHQEINYTMRYSWLLVCAIFLKDVEMVSLILDNRLDGEPFEINQYIFNQINAGDVNLIMVAMSSPDSPQKDQIIQKLRQSGAKPRNEMNPDELVRYGFEVPHVNARPVQEQVSINAPAA